MNSPTKVSSIERMITKTSVKSVFFLIIGFHISSFGQQKWTLQDCITYALENNISIKQAELDTDVASINKRGALGQFLPSVNLRGSHTWNLGLNQNIISGLLEYQTVQFTSVGASVAVDLYKGLQNQDNFRRANLSIIANQYQLEKMKDDVSLNVANAFLQILFNKENLKVQKEQLANNTKQLERITELVNAGIVPKGDMLEMQATVAGDTQKVINAENALLISRLSLAQLLQLDDFKDFDIVDTVNYSIENAILLKTPSEIYSKAKEERPELKVAQANLEIAQKELSIARGNYQPTLQAFYNIDTRAGYADRVTGYELDPDNPTKPIGFIEGSDINVLQPNTRVVTGSPLPILEQFDKNKGQNFGVQLAVPVFNGFSARNKVEQSKVGLERSKIDYEQKRLDLERAIYTAFTDAKGALKAYEAAITTEQSREEALRYTKERYEVGMMNAFEYNQSQTLFVNAQSEVLRTKYDYLFRVKILEFYFGIPITQN